MAAAPNIKGAITKKKPLSIYGKLFLSIWTDLEF